MACFDVRNANDNLAQIFEGLYADFNSLWYNDVGVSITSIMVSNMYWPLLEMVIFTGLRIGYRMIDQCSLWPTNHYNTKSKTKQAFIETYQGDEFKFHYKYSYILVVVFVTFTFGAALPILFPIAFTSLLIFYVTERIMIVYSYREPPMYTSEANIRALSIMRIAPFIYCCFGVWVFSNQQVFRNVVVPRETHVLFPQTNHTFNLIFSQLTPGSTFLLLLAVLVSFAFQGWLKERWTAKN